MARIRATLLATHPSVREVVVGGRDIMAASAVAQSCNAKPASIEDAIAHRADAVVLATATQSHASLLPELLELGVPVFCEKPLTANLSVSEAIASQARQKGICVQMGYHRRFDPGFEALRDTLAGSEEGVLYSVSVTSFDHKPGTPAFIANSGGMFRDFHVHDFDLVRWVTQREFQWVFAAAGALCGETYQRLDDVDTTAVVAQLEGGALVTLRGGRHNPLGQDVRMEVQSSTHSLVAGLSDRSPLRQVCERNYFSSPTYSDFRDRFGSAFARETAAFVDVVAGQRENPCPISEDLAAFRLALACERSASTGSREAPPLSTAT